MKIESATGLVLRVRPLTDTSLIVHWRRSPKERAVRNRRFGGRWICFIWRT